MRVMFYNVENLFDTVDDSLIDDSEFLPNGARGWGNRKYWDKINALYKVIVASGKWSPPEIIGLCEVENRGVIEDLIYGTNLSNYGYSIVHGDSPDLRGIDVCMVYRKESVRIINYNYFEPENWKDEGFLSRQVLYAECELLGDTLHLFVNHWPSKRGGVLATQERRLEAAKEVKEKVDSTFTKFGKDAKIIVTGDFNSSEDDGVFEILTGEGGSLELLKNNAQGLGTYKYQGKWENIDQMLVSNGLLSDSAGITTDQGRYTVIASDFMLIEDKSYSGLKPFSTWSGFNYQGGYSDHLPIVLELASH